MGNIGKIVFIGAGSMSFGLSTYRDLFSSSRLKGCTISLVDNNPEALARMTALAHAMNKEKNTGLIIESTTDRRAAFKDANFVINSIAIERTRLWQLDFEIPKKYGVRHTLGENGGPGGLFFTLRTLPLIFDFIRDMEEICPKAIFINFSNPESRIVMALGKYSKIANLGLCHGISMARGAVSYIMGKKWEEIEVWGAGMNHYQWLMQIRDRQTGEDLYPLLKEKEPGFDPSYNPLSRKLLRSFGYWPTCSDDHLGEYLSFGWEGGEHGYDFAEDAKGRVHLQKEIDEVVAGGPVPADWYNPSGEHSIDVVDGVLNNRHTYLEAAIVYNRGVIPNLPYDLAVEVPALVDAAGVHPISLGPLPDQIAKLALMQASVQQLSVEAAVHASKEIALQALLIDPVINSTDAAVKILDELWEANRPYIRKCV